MVIKKEQNYKLMSMTSSFYQEQLDYMMDIELISYSTGNANYEVSIYDIKERKHIYEGTLRETIELILLGKLYKEQLQVQVQVGQPAQPIA